MFSYIFPLSFPILIVQFFKVLPNEMPFIYIVLLYFVVGFQWFCMDSFAHPLSHFIVGSWVAGQMYRSQRLRLPHKVTDEYNCWLEQAGATQIHMFQVDVVLAELFQILHQLFVALSKAVLFYGRDPTWFDIFPLIFK